MTQEPLRRNEDLKVQINLSLCMLALTESRKQWKLAGKYEQTEGYELRVVNQGKQSKACLSRFLSVSLHLQR